MRLEQLRSLTEDELAILWFCINKIDPPVITGVELEPPLFPSINHTQLIDKLTYCRPKIKEEHFPLFDGLVEKLRVF